MFQYPAVNFIGYLLYLIKITDKNTPDKAFYQDISPEQALACFSLSGCNSFAVIFNYAFPLLPF